MARHKASEGRSQRQLRVGEEIRHALSAIFLRSDFRDPALYDLNVTVTEVRISPDLKNATAFVVPLGGKDMPSTVAALNHAAPFLRSQLAKSVRLQHIPRLSFEPDMSLDYAQKIETLLLDPLVQQDIQNPDE